MVTVLDFGYDGVSSSLAEFIVYFFFFNFFFQLFFSIMYVTQTPPTTDSPRAVQGACHNQLATTLYTAAACQQSKKQHHTRAVVCPRCIIVASYIVAFVVGTCEL